MMQFLRLLPALIWAAPAQAHGTLAGGGGFYAGAAHPFLAVEHLLLLLAAGMLLGRARRDQGPRAARAPLWGLAAGLAAGLLVGATGVQPRWLAELALALAMLAGGALAAGTLRPPQAVALAAGLVAGLVVGLDTGVPAQAGGIAALAPYAGVFAGVFLIVLNMMALGSVAVRPPFTIALRIAGSWIAAVALMVLALQLRGAAGVS